MDLPSKSSNRQKVGCPSSIRAQGEPFGRAPRSARDAAAGGRIFRRRYLVMPRDIFINHWSLPFLSEVCIFLEIMHTSVGESPLVPSVPVGSVHFPGDYAYFCK